MILILLFIWIGIHTTIYNSDYHLKIELAYNLLKDSDYQPKIQNKHFISDESMNNADSNILNAHYVRTPTPNFLYFEYLAHNDPYSSHTQEKEEQPSTCKKVTCATLCCSIVSIFGCLLFHSS